VAGKSGYRVPEERASWVADLNLIVQMVLLAVLFAGRMYAKRRDLSVHHNWMTAAVVINAVMIVAIMNPAFFRLLPLVWQRLGALGPMVLWVHVVTASLAELLGLYAVLSVRMDLPDSLQPRNLKWFMRFTFLLWALALGAGMVIYWGRYM